MMTYDANTLIRQRCGKMHTRSRGWTKAALGTIRRWPAKWWRPAEWRWVPEWRLPAPKGCGLPKPAAAGAAAKALGTGALRAEAARPAALLLLGSAE